MQTAGLTHEGLGPGTNASERYDNRFDPPEIHPDDSTLAYTYDDAHRITAAGDALGNTIHYALDAMGNRMKAEVKDPSGALVRSQRRVYDAFNRVQNLITPAQ